jgi:hypothetical protein
MRFFNCYNPALFVEQLAPAVHEFKESSSLSHPPLESKRNSMSFVESIGAMSDMSRHNIELERPSRPLESSTPSTVIEPSWILQSDGLLDRTFNPDESDSFMNDHPSILEEKFTGLETPSANDTFFGSSHNYSIGDAEELLPEVSEAEKSFCNLAVDKYEFWDDFEENEKENMQDYLVLEKFPAVFQQGEAALQLEQIYAAVKNSDKDLVGFI